VTATEEETRLLAEMRELDLLIESSQTEVNRQKSREDQTRAKADEVRHSPQNFQREEIFAATDELTTAIGRRMTMEGELATLLAKRRLLDRVQGIVERLRQPQLASQAAATAAAAASDDTRLLQAVVDTQEEERKRIARQVHDGPAQAMANVVLQSEISERLFDIDQGRSRQELAALRQMVNKTLQELRGFIFELRPMILDDLGLVPTLRRYVQTLIDKHGIRFDFSSTGRDRRLKPDEEVAIFRLIQDSVVERIEKADGKDLVLSMSWKDESLEIHLDTDGKELPLDGELASGLRRSERLELLKATAQNATRDGRVTLDVVVPLAAATVEMIR
jgi:two-component system sensor histidine kinase DegS